MPARVFDRVLWQVRRQLDMLGWLGAAGIALMIFALVFQLSIARVLDQELGALGREAERLHTRSRMAPLAAQSVEQGSAQQLDTFYEFFPAVATLPHWLLRLYATAEKHDLALENGSYQLLHEKGRRLARYQITLPLHGTYDQIRGFVGGVLKEIPAIAVENIGLQRETIGTTALDASIKLTLFVRMEGR